MLLGNLIKSVNKSYKRIAIKGISFDSRKTKKNDIFFAIEGSKKSGTRFVKEAILKGSSAIVIDKKKKIKNLNIPLIKVKNVRKSLSEACSKFYRKKPKNIIAVTGTNGKSSVANFFYQILDLNKISAASIGTLGIVSKKYNKRLSLTSLDPLSLHRNLEILAKKKINNVILEASSHGLHQNRLDSLVLKGGVFTNLSHDHLDYHKNMKSYLSSKIYLFRNLLKKNSYVITDEENKEFSILKSIANNKKLRRLTIGSNSGNIKILEKRYFGHNQIIKILLNSKVIEIKIPLIGNFQIKNLLMAILAASTCGVNKNKILKQINRIKPVSGRLECVANLNNNSSIILDFAHTPEALRQSIIALKKQFRKDITIVFGCGGERDKKKRLTMGKIAKKYCKKIFITDDNPRGENPSKIRDAIIKGCKGKAINIGSRKRAIETAINELEANEIILVAGKGHEINQDYGNRIIKFSDKQTINKAVKKKKFVLRKKKYKHHNFLLKKTFNKTFKSFKYQNISINTRTLKKNDLFFAIKGKKTDGHKFVGQAIKKGAIGAVVDKKINKVSNKKIIKVKNTFSSLNDLARVTRENTSAQIIGVTGSVGKTTLKNLISFVLKNYGKVSHSPQSYNNKFGVPISLCNLKKDTKFGVFEIGMDKKGEIENLSKIVKPEVGIITNISGAHFKNFNTLKDIAKAKAEIMNNIQENGSIVLNKDDNFFNFLSHIAKKKKLKIISFSTKRKADIFLLGIKKSKNIYRLKIQVNKKNYYFKSTLSTSSFINNILACISTLFILNLDLTRIKSKFTNSLIPSGRGDIKMVKKFNKKFKVIDESYNANPLSMSSAIKNMAHYKSTNNSKKLVLLGDMLELGKRTKKFHKELSKVINRSDIDKVFVYGKYIKETFNSLSKNKKGKIFNNLNEANEHFSKIINNNDLLMIKGSNATGLNQFSKNIKRGEIRAI
tara:strand:- start:25942 stop:28794 length:2853 start_codon:yes stop_codon:yes gene_type:complete